MKKLLILSIAACALILSACSKKEAKTESSENKNVQASAAESQVQASKPAAELGDDEALLDDGEEGCFWNPVLDSWEEWGNKYLVSEFSDSADTTDEWQSEGSSSITFGYKKMAGDGTAAHFFCTDILETNWSDYTKLRFDVNNKASGEITLQFYTKSGDTWAWSDTDAIAIAPGESAVEFDISSRGAAHKENILEMGFVIYGAEEDSQLLLDNLRLAK